MNFSEAIEIANSFMKEQALPRKKEAEQFYNKMTMLFLPTSFIGYFAIIYTSRQIHDLSSLFTEFNLVIVLAISFYLGISLYYLMTLLHDYVHASKYYSKTSCFLIENIAPIILPMNSSGYRWGHFQHHFNTNRFSEEFDTLPPFIMKKNLKTFWVNVVIHSCLIIAIFTVRIILNPLTAFSAEKRLIYFNYISPLGKISPKAYPIRSSETEFKRNFRCNLISLVSILIFWAASGFSLVFWLIYSISIAICSAWIAFRSLVDHACIDVQGEEEVMKANFYFTSNFSRRYFWYAGFATYHLVHHINSNVPHYFCQELNDLLCEKIPEYQVLHQKRDNLLLVIKDFFAEEVSEADLLAVN
jgi:fatty acid desaturase